MLRYVGICNGIWCFLFVFCLKFFSKFGILLYVKVCVLVIWFVRVYSLMFKFFVMLCSLLAVLAHHLWVHFSKSTLFCSCF